MPFARTTHFGSVETTALITVSEWFLGLHVWCLAILSYLDWTMWNCSCCWSKRLNVDSICSLTSSSVSLTGQFYPLAILPKILHNKTTSKQGHILRVLRNTCFQLIMLSMPTLEERVQFSSVQSLSCVQLFAAHEPQHTRPPCPSPTPRVHPNLCPSSQ